MARARSLGLGGVAISSVVLVFIACSSPAPTDSGTSSGSSGDDKVDAAFASSSSGSTTSSSSGSSGGTSSSGGVDVDSTCIGADAGKNKCSNCCTVLHAAGSKAYDDALIKCLCASPAVCKTECNATMCATPTLGPDDACDACVRASLATGGNCIRQVTTDCAAAPDCAAVTSCVLKCK